MIETEIGGKKYRIRSLSAMQQFHLARKIGPLVPSLVPVIRQAIGGAGGDGVERALGLVSAAGPAFDVLSEMPDDKAESIIAACMMAVQRCADDGKTWADTWSQQAGAPMFDDINGKQLLQLSGMVIKQELSPFLPATPIVQSQEKAV